MIVLQLLLLALALLALAYYLNSVLKRSERQRHIEGPSTLIRALQAERKLHEDRQMVLNWIAGDPTPDDGSRFPHGTKYIKRALKE